MASAANRSIDPGSVVVVTGASAGVGRAIARMLGSRKASVGLLARAAVGRYLMRHDNAMLFGFFAQRPDPQHRFHKQVALNDWYFGDPGSDAGAADAADADTGDVGDVGGDFGDFGGGDLGF